MQAMRAAVLDLFRKITSALELRPVSAKGTEHGLATYKLPEHHAQIAIQVGMHARACAPAAYRDTRTCMQAQAQAHAQAHAPAHAQPPL